MVSCIIRLIIEIKGKVKNRMTIHTLKTCLQVASFPFPVQYPQVLFLTCPACEEPQVILVDPEGKLLVE